VRHPHRRFPDYDGMYADVAASVLILLVLATWAILSWSTP
jgi:hypothetical protein